MIKNILLCLALVVTNKCQCTDHFYLNSGQCQPCHSTCKTCFGNLDDQCLSCVDGQYLDNGDRCKPCHSTCKTCYDNRDDQCLSCVVGQYLDNAGRCKSCHYSCKNCDGNNDNDCLSCEADRQLTGGKCICIDGTYDDSGLESCEPCHYSCKTCDEKNDNDCLSCQIDRQFTGGKCVCIDGTYDDISLQSCQLCHITCQTCQGSLSNECNTCDTTIRNYGGGAFSTCSCLDGTYDDISYTCQVCHISCLTCTTTATTCTTCDISDFRDLSGTTCPCITHYYDIGNEACDQCSVRCHNCSGSASFCTSCPADRQKVGSTCQCLAGTYQNPITLNCDPCTNYCQTCENSSSTCLSCFSFGNRILYNATCACFDGFYDNSVLNCQPCHYSCSQCLGPSPPVCTVCPDGSHRTLTSGQCPCDDGYYDDGSVVCLPCVSTCLTCDSLLTCLSCNPTQMRIISGTHCQCMDGYQQNSTTLVCQPCHYSCLTCFGSQNSMCYTCKNLRDYDNYTCPCQIGYYQMLQNCYPCDPICKTCSSSASICTSCISSRTLTGTTCVCAFGFFISGNTCQPCSAQCQTCTTSASFCLSCHSARGTYLSSNTCVCPDGTYQNSTYYCLPCHQNCLTCSASGSNSCLDCQSDDFRTLSGTQCVCIDGYYDIGIPQCAVCHSKCLTCYGPSEYNCKSCVSGLNLIGSFCKTIPTCSDYLYEGLCIAVCPQGTYPDAHKCLDCPRGCTTCVSNTLCTQCMTNYLLNPSIGICTESCASGNYITSRNTCQPCPSSCETCIIGGTGTSVYCDSCVVGYLREEGKCVMNCRRGYVLWGGHCQRCIPNCATCSSLSSSACLTCLSGTYLLASQCYQVCPNGYQSLGSICQLCQSPCLTCSQNKCSSCQQGYYLSFSSSCVPLGYFQRNSRQYKCHPNCLSCTDQSFHSCLMCSARRGDRSQMAISGYCDCWEGTLDTGQGYCDSQTYQFIQQTNQILVGSTQATLFITVLSSIVSVNFIPTFSFVSYLQIYSSFYYTNSSALLQTQKILKQYSRIHPNTYFRQKNPYKTNQSRLLYPQPNLHSRILLSAQDDASLFARGQQFVYLHEWALPVIVITIIVWSFSFAFFLLSCVFSGKNEVSNIDGQKKVKKKFSFKRGFTIIKQFYNQAVPILLFLFTYCEIYMYGLVHLKLIANGYFQKLNIGKTTLSILVLVYYVGYLVRIFVGVLVGKFEELRKRPSKVWILFHGYRLSARKNYHALFVPVNIVKNILIISMIVLLSRNPVYQTGISAAIFVFFFLLNLCICPWIKQLRICFHLQQIIFVVQLFVLFYLTRIPQKQKVRPSIILIYLNFVQLLIVLGMIVRAIYKASRSTFSDSRKREQNMDGNLGGQQITRQKLQNQDSYSDLFENRMRNYEEQECKDNNDNKDQRKEQQ